MKKQITLVLIICSLLIGTIVVNGATTVTFQDVPSGHWSETYINQLRELGITDGVGDNQFGFDMTLTREQFVKFLGTLNQWDLIHPSQPTFSDVANPKAWSYDYIETALSLGIIENQGNLFRPSDMITREEMGLMIVKSLGYGWLAEYKANESSEFSDVQDHVGYIKILGDLGIVNGNGDGTFNPDGNAKRQEAAAILIRMYNLQQTQVEEVNAFYAIKSYPQMDLMGDFDQISFSWANVERQADEFNLNLDFPDGYSEPYETAKELGNKTMLSIYLDDLSAESGYVGSLTYFLSQPDKYPALIDDILVALDEPIEFDGVMIDFESLSGLNNRVAYVAFLEQLSEALRENNKLLGVMVHPNVNFNGYDYGQIAALSDQMIMMAHDYEAKTMDPLSMEQGFTSIPVAPLYSVYEALATLKSQVATKDFYKVSLQLSFSAAQLVLSDEGKVINSNPYNPTYDKIYNRLIMSETVIDYGVNSRNPYANFVDSNNHQNVLWYEDARSIEEKIELAKIFGIENISIWRLGNIPEYDDVDSKEVYMDVMSLFE